MEPVWRVFAVFAVSGLLLLVSGPATSEAAICSHGQTVNFTEGNTVGDLVTNIIAEPEVVLEFKPPPDNPDNPFILEGTRLIANRELDYETSKTHVVKISCRLPATAETLPLTIVVVLINVNDNPPVFESPSYSIEVNEMLSINESAGTFRAKDLDDPQQLYYTLTSASNHFRLRSQTAPDVLVNARLDYDTVPNVQLILTAQDTPLTSPAEKPSFTATATIMVNISDGDNRPPWFQPCKPENLGLDKVCQFAGYTGTVVLNEMVPGALPLDPGPLYAIDGDSGINERITYSFLSGHEGGLFAINPDTGSITMLKVADVVGTVVLTVLAAQTRNSYQFSTTTVTISVQVKSLHEPRFQKPLYEGLVTSLGGMAMDQANKDQPLRIIATDEDYMAAGGINPHITYSINGSNAFFIFDGHLFMTTNLPDSTLSLQVIATDTSNGQSATAELEVEVKAGVPTTTLPPSTPGKETTPSTGEPPTEGNTSSIPSSNTPSTAEPGSGDYGAGDMAALGATLGILLFASLVVIGVLVHHMRRGKADLKKIFEASVFRSSLGQSGQKEGIQYTNEAFQDDEDRGSTGSGGPGKGGVLAGKEPSKSSWNIPSKEAIQRSSAPLHGLLPDLLPDNTSEAASDKNDNETGVKPILTKERRVEEGYKKVWFKEDIDPNAKEEVVIIPDSREDDREDDRQDDSEDDDQHLSNNGDNEEDDDEDNPQTKPSKIKFAETDLDSGLGVKIEYPAGDSDSASDTENIDL